MPNETLSIQYNGQIVDAIHLLSGGLTLNNANWRNQFATCDDDLLHPPIRTTEKTIATNHYLLRRSLEIIGSNNPDRKHVTRLRNIITFEDLYKRVGADTKLEQQRTREITTKILDFFVEKGLLKGYTLEKKDSGKIYSIHIQF